MSNRRNFLVLMGATASSLVLSNIGKDVFDPAHAQEAPCKLDDASDAVEGGIDGIGNVGTKTQALSKAVASGNQAQITALSDQLELSVDAQTAFWGDQKKVALFITGAAASAQKSAAQSLKGKFSDKQIAAAVEKSLKNIKANNLSAVESDPIIGPVVKAGYTAASAKFKQASALRNRNKTLRNDLRVTIENKVETEAIKLKRESKLTDRDLQQLSTQYPSLAPRLRKAIDFKVQPIKPGSGIQLPNPKIPVPQPGIPGLPGQLKPGSSSNKFDVYAQAFDRRLLAMDAPIKDQGDLTLVDRILGIEKANACDPVVCLGVILGIAAITAIVVIVGIGAVSAATTNETCKELLLKQQQAEQIAACEKRANKRRKSRLKEARKGKAACQALFFCDFGFLAAQHDIESDFERDVDACS